AERHAKAPALALAGQRKRHLTLGHDLGLGRLARTGVGLGGGVGAEAVVDVVDTGELAATTLDAGLAEAQPAALGLELPRHALAVVAGDRAAAGAGLVEHRPARQIEPEFAIDEAGSACRRGSRQQSGGQYRGQQDRAEAHGSDSLVIVAPKATRSGRRGSCCSAGGRKNKGTAGAVPSKRLRRYGIQSRSRSRRASQR